MLLPTPVESMCIQIPKVAYRIFLNSLGCGLTGYSSAQAYHKRAYSI